MVDSWACKQICVTLSLTDEEDYRKQRTQNEHDVTRRNAYFTGRWKYDADCMKDRPFSAGAVAMPARVDVPTTVRIGLPQPPGAATRDAAFEAATEAALTPHPADRRTGVTTLYTHIHIRPIYTPSHHSLQ